MTSKCKAPKTSCGTASGWRAGGRCVRCRLAHNAETNRYRSVSQEQRSRFLDLLNASLSPEEAAAQAGTTVPSLAVSAAYDGELRAALNGQPVVVQRAARKGDFLAALTRAGGVVQDALLIAGVDAETVEAWRVEDPAYADVEDAVARWLAPLRTQRYTVLTDEKLDQAAALLEEGQNIAAAARAVGATSTGLRKASARHARLAAALPPLKSLPLPGRPSGLTPKVEKEVRRMWAIPDLPMTVMARRLSVSTSTLGRWARDLGLPVRGTFPGRIRSGGKGNA